MTANLSSPDHPHGPEIPSAITSEGRCRWCHDLVVIDQLLAFLNALIPQPADHAPVEDLSDPDWVQCSDNESGHPKGACPNEVFGDTEVTVTVSAIRNANHWARKGIPA